MVEPFRGATRHYTNEQYLDEIKRVADELEKSPTWNEFDEHGEMATQSVMQRFGSWNDAKEKAGVRIYPHGPSGEKDPNSKIGIVRQAKNTDCPNCGEGHSSALCFHHLPEYEKKFNISQFRNAGVTEEELQEEINKCIVICSNCHRKIHSEDHPLTADDVIDS
jgi:hypothetical protein